MKIAVCISITVAILSAGGLSAQTVTAPAAINPAGQTALHTAGNAVGIVPTAHEIPAQVVGGTVPATVPLTQGVTVAGRDLSGGATQTGTNVGKYGVKVAPTAITSPARQYYAGRAAKGVVTSAATTATSAVGAAPAAVPAIHH
jgi:hypothetical protein